MGYDTGKLLKGFIPAPERDWYPYEWPSEAWLIENQYNRDVWEEKRREIQQLVDDDFFFFCDVVMRDADHPHLWPTLHDELCYIIQNNSDCLNLLPRGHLKSTIGAIDYPIWVLGKNPNARIVIFSHTIDESKKFLRSIKQHILYNKRLKYIFPHLEPAAAGGLQQFEKWNDEEIIVKRDKFFLKENSVTAGSTGQPFTGDHCDIIIFDDIVTAKNANTDEKMAKLKQWHEDVLHLLDWKYRTIYNGTRYKDGDLYGDLIVSESIPFNVRKHIEDSNYIWPHPLNIKNMEKKKKNMSLYNIACQFDNDPIAEGTQEFEAKWIKRWNIDKVRNEFVDNPPQNDEELLNRWYSSLNIYMGCDPARGQKKIDNYTVIMVVGSDKRGRMFVLEYLRKHYRTHEITENFIRLFKKWKNLINAKIETYGGDIHVYNNIIKKMEEEGLPYFRVKKYKTTAPTLGAGNDRIRALQSPLHDGLIWIGEGGEWTEIEQELTRFPHGRTDDLITTMAYLWTQQVKPVKETIEKQRPTGWRYRQYQDNGKQGWLRAV